MLALHFALAVSATWNKSNTFDEIAHITGGYSYWRLGDYRLNPEAGILGQRIMALPLMAGQFNLPTLDQDAWRHSDLWRFGYQFFYEAGNRPETILLLSRSIMAAVGVGLGLLIWTWSRRLFGPQGGALSLAIYALSPPFLANAPLGAVDVLASLCFLLSLWALWRLMERFTLQRLFASSLALAGLFLAKMSGLLVLPMIVIIVVLRLVRRQDIKMSLGLSRMQLSGLAKPALIAAAAAVHVAVLWGVIWLAYDLRYEAFRHSRPGHDRFYRSTATILDNPNPGPFGQVLQFTQKHRLLPEAYIQGMAYTWSTTQGRYCFLNGRYSATGWRSFFPYAIAVKTPLPVFALLGLAAAAAVATMRARRPQSTSMLQLVGRGLYRTSPLWVLIGIYLASAIGSHLNIGHRHVLPVYAPAIVLAGAAGYWLTSASRRMKLLVTTLVILLAAETLLAWPNYLAYFNQLIGARSSAHRHLVDSSLDWGQDLPELKHYLSRSGDPAMPVYLSYFGSASPDYYGIVATRLPGYINFLQAAPPSPARLRPGLYCVSATMLAGVLPPLPGPWVASRQMEFDFVKSDFDQLLELSDVDRQAAMQGPYREHWEKVVRDYEQLRYARLLHFLRSRRPNEQINGTILLYRLNELEIAIVEAGRIEVLPDSANPFVP